MSDKALKSYLENKNRVVGTTLGYYGYKEALNPSVKVASSVDPNKDIIHVVEALKDKLVSLGKEETCMNNTFAISFPTNGFHPKSEVCQRCKLRDTCRTQLVTNVDFDIIGLRLGRITPEEAKREAYVRRNK